jgi:hypothetical protein
MITSTTDKELQGDGQTAPLESFNMCKYDSDGTTPYKGVTQSCRFKDYEGRCVLERCYYEQDESPEVAHKLWIKCIACGDPFSIPPNQMRIPICSKCQSILYQHLHYPQTCCKCGATIAEPTAMPFTRLCSECQKQLLFNDACARFLPAGPVDLTPLDLP